jgi:uncharacterized protein
VNLSMSFVDVIVIFIVMGIGATIQGAAGYGMALIAGPILMIIDPDFIPGPMVVAAFVLVALVIIRDRQALDFRGLKWVFFGFLLGVGLGLVVIKSFSSEQFATIFGVMILVAVVMSVIGFRFKPTKPALSVAGFMAGVMSVLTTTSGPPIALVYQDSPGKKLRATISGFFVAGTVIVVTSLFLVDKLGLHELFLALYLIPGILLGFLASTRVAKWVDQGYTRSIVLIISALSAIVLLVNQIFN